jgi:hypothetical protein
MDQYSSNFIACIHITFEGLGKQMVRFLHLSFSGEDLRTAFLTDS